MNEESNMKMTGKNFLLASLVALIAIVLITLMYSLIGFLGNASINGDFTTAFSSINRMFFPLLRSVGICVAPIAFLITFALLQRFRIKK